MDFVVANGGEVPAFLARAVQRGGFDLFDKEYFDWGRKDLKFNGVKYKTWKELEETEIPNYNGVNIYSSEVEADIETLISMGAVKEIDASRAEKEKFVFSPINMLDNKRLIFHWRFNAGYKRPHLYLGSPLNELREIEKSEKLLKTDLRKCYFQYPLVPENYSKLGFRFGDRCFYWTVLALGPSPAVYMAQKTQRFSCDFYSFWTGKWVYVYIDDMLSRPGGEEVDVFLTKKLGYIFSKGKRQEGFELDFCGFSLNCKEKTVKVKAETAVEIAEGVEEVLKGCSAFDFQSFCGKITFASQVAVEGRTNTHAINGLLGDLQRKYGKFLPKTGTITLNQEVVSELQFWQQINSHEALNFDSRELKVLPLQVTTDASSTAYGVTIGNLKVRGTFGADLADEPIQVKETAALHLYITEYAPERTDLTVCIDNQSLKHSFDRKFSKNVSANNLLKEIFQALAKKKSALNLLWIPTKIMADSGADPLTRNFKKEFEDSKALSEFGGKRLRRYLGSKVENIIDLFASAVDNPLQANYCHVFHDRDDHLALGVDAFEYLDRLGTAEVGFWLYAYWGG